MLGAVRFAPKGTQSWLMLTHKPLAKEILPIFSAMLKEVYETEVVPVPGNQAH